MSISEIVHNVWLVSLPVLILICLWRGISAACIFTSNRAELQLVVSVIVIVHAVAMIASWFGASIFGVRLDDISGCIVLVLLWCRILYLVNQKRGSSTFIRKR